MKLEYALRSPLYELSIANLQLDKKRPSTLALPS